MIFKNSHKKNRSFYNLSLYQNFQIDKLIEKFEIDIIFKVSLIFLSSYETF